MRTRWTVAVWIAVLGAMGPCACQKEAEPPRPKSTAARSRRTVGVVPKGLAHIFWQSVHAGAEAADDEFGVEIIWQGPAKETEYELQRSIVEDLLAEPA